MKKVLVIEASPRKGYCNGVSDFITGKMQNQYELDVVHLRDYKINPCKGCAVCLFEGSSKCPERGDDAMKILNKMHWADGIIFIVPNYALAVPGLLKNLLDRLAYVFHRPRLFNKACLTIVVQGVIGGGKIAKYVNEVMGYWGMNPVKGAVVTGGVYLNRPKPSQLEGKDNQTILQSLERFYSEINRSNAKSPSLLRLLMFRMARTAIQYNQDSLPPDKAYYKKMGWFDAPYYHEVKLSKFKKMLGVVFDGLAKRMVVKG